MEERQSKALMKLLLDLGRVREAKNFQKPVPRTLFRSDIARHYLKLLRSGSAGDCLDMFGELGTVMLEFEFL